MDIEARLEIEFRDFIQQDEFPYYFYVHDAKGVMTYIGENAIKYFGLSEQEWKSDYLTYLTANPINKEAIQNTVRCLSGKQQEPYRIEVYDKEYRPHYIQVFEKPIFEEGKVVRVEGVAKILG